MKNFKLIKNKLKKAFSLIEILLVSIISMSILISAFVLYSYISEKMLINKEVEFMDKYVIATIDLYKGRKFMELDKNPDIVDYIAMSEGIKNQKEIRKKIIISPLGENIQISNAKSQYSTNSEYKSSRGMPYVLKSYEPTKGMYTKSRCIKLANIYLAKYGNVATSDSDEAILDTDPNKIQKIIKLCEPFQENGGSPYFGLKFYFG